MGKKQQKRAGMKLVKKAARAAHEVCRAHDLSRGHAEEIPHWEALTFAAKEQLKEEVISILTHADECQTVQAHFGRVMDSIDTEEAELMHANATSLMRDREYLFFTTVMQVVRLIG